MSDEELALLLNALLYTQAISETNIDNNIYDIFITSGKDYQIKEVVMITDEQWQALLKTLQEKPEYYKNIVLKDIEETQNREKNVCFYNYNTGEAHVVYRGTGAREWHDNAKGASWLQADTRQQENALQYLEKVSQQYPKVIVSGHSKGGNKAQYATIVLDSDIVKHCYSFDGQGMGPGFLFKYQDTIIRNQNKITSICNRSDFVNVLFTEVAGKIQYLDNDRDLLAWFFDKQFNAIGYQHSPFSMFSITDGVLTIANSEGIIQDQTALFIGYLSDYLSKNMNYHDYMMFCDLVMHLFDGGKCSDNFDPMKLPVSFYIMLIEQIMLMLKELNFEDVELMEISYTILQMLLGEKKFEKILDSIQLLEKVQVGILLMYRKNKSFLMKTVYYCQERLKGEKSEISAIDISMLRIQDFNIKYQTQLDNKEVIRDFSIVMQEAMYDILSCNEEMPFYNLKELDIPADAFHLHQAVINCMVELAEVQKITKRKYYEIIKDIYKEEQRFIHGVEQEIEKICYYQEIMTKSI